MKIFSKILFIQGLQIKGSLGLHDTMCTFKFIKLNSKGLYHGNKAIFAIFVVT